MKRNYNMSNVTKMKNQQKPLRGEMTYFILSTLSAVLMGMTRHELKSHDKLPFNTVYHKRGGAGFETTLLDNTLTGLVKRRRIRITGFRSGKHNGMGAAIY